MTPELDPLERTHRRFGWTALVGFLLLGIFLEALHGLKAGFYLSDPLRATLWRLAHAHGTLFALVNLVFPAGARLLPTEGRRALASRSLRTASVLLPVGFFAGGIAHPEGDPSLGIVLVPLGALLAALAVGLVAAGTWRRGTGAGIGERPR
jgi:hypothetical protein